MTIAILVKRLLLLQTSPTRNYALFSTPLSTLNGSKETLTKSHRDIDWNRVLSLTASENQDTIMKVRSRHADLQSAITEAKEQPQGTK